MTSKKTNSKRAISKKTTSKKKRLSRRGVLRGMGGVALGLPFLEYFMPGHTAAQDAPKRFALLFGGFSIGSSEGNHLVPPLGPYSAPLPIGTRPLDDFGIRDHVSMVSGLSIPAAEDPPAGGRGIPFHSTSHQVLFTGQRYSGGALGGESVDWAAARFLAGETPHKVLNYRAQPSFYRVNSRGTHDGRISARRNESGELEQVDPIVSPRLAYETLFSGFVPPDPEEAARARRELAMRSSVLDLVADDAERLVSRLGQEDKRRMERHFDELRTLEGRLAMIPPPETSTCVMLPHPGDDPPVGDAIDPSAHIEAGTYNEAYRNANGYSDEDLRAEVMTDLIHMAFACDSSRVSSFMLTYAQCFMNMYTALGLPSDLHEFTHGAISQYREGEAHHELGMQGALGDAAAWHLKHYARLVQKLSETEDVDGRTLLDNTAACFAFEGGWGYDPAGGSDSSPHSTENMVMLVGGHGGGLNPGPGAHIDGAGAHPAAVWNTVLRSLGGTETMGEVDGFVDGLT